MMKSFRLIIAMVFLLAGCASLPQGFSMYPKPLQLEETVPPGMAVILVGISGSASINYLQFTHSSMPAINVKFDAVADDIVAIVIPVGIKQMELNTITVGGHRSGYFSTGMSYGYIAVHTPKLDIDKPGLYYIATLDTNSPGQYRVVPIAEQLKKFQDRFGDTAGKLEPINFAWPN